jgi:hypothetical protein
MEREAGRRAAAAARQPGAPRGAARLRVRLQVRGAPRGPRARVWHGWPRPNRLLPPAAAAAAPLPLRRPPRRPPLPALAAPRAIRQAAGARRTAPGTGKAARRSQPGQGGDPRVSAGRGGTGRRRRARPRRGRGAAPPGRQLEGSSVIGHADGARGAGHGVGEWGVSVGEKRIASAASLYSRGGGPRGRGLRRRARYGNGQ